MKAWLLDQLNGIEHLRLAEIPDPTPQPGEVLLEVRYAALNPADRYLADRQYPARPALPHILGRDGLGIVLQAPGDSAGIRTGQKYAILRGDAGGNKPGTFAQRIVVPAVGLVELPPGWTEQEAAGASLVYLTAYQALTMWGPLPVSSVVLVSGASGGVGVATVQLASAMGYTVVALSRSAEKAARLQQQGATLTCNQEAARWREEAKTQLAPRRVALVVDNIGGKLLPEMIDLLDDSGRVSLVGRLAGPVPDFNTATLFFRRIRLGGVAVGAYSNPESRAAWQEILRLLGRSGRRPLVDSIFAFEQIQKAFARLAQGPMGKVLLQVQA